jgi:outer membrane protein assembly factor BamB
MNNKGDINPGALLELFQDLGSSNKIFKINFSRDNGHQTDLIYKEGVLYYIPNDNHKGLEIFLIGEEVISFDQIEEIMKFKKESGLTLEQLLVQADILTEEKLKKIIEQITRDIVLDLFIWENGKFEALEIATYADENLWGFPLSGLGDCEGEIHQMLNWVSVLGGLNSIYKTIGLISGTKIDGVSENNKNQFSTSIDGKNSIQEIINWSIFTVSKTLRILNELKSKNLIDLSKSNDEPAQKTSDQVIEEEKKKDQKSNQNEELSTDTPLPSSGNFSGSLSILSLLEVMQTLNSARRTGTLTLDIKNGPAILNLINGELVSVTYADLVNKDAFYKVVSIKKGEFYFETNSGSFPKEMDIPTMSLLMEAMRLSDEGSRKVTSESIDAAFEERPMAASRVLKRKESKLRRMIKLGVFVVLSSYFIYFFLIEMPAKEKSKAFTMQRNKVDTILASNKFIEARESWDKFLKDNKESNPGWEEDILQEKLEILTKHQETCQSQINEIEKLLKVGDYSKAIEKLNKLETIIPKTQKDLEKTFNKTREKFNSLYDQATKKQKEFDFKNWKANMEANIVKANDLVADFDNEKAFEILKTFEQNLDEKKEKDLFEKIQKLKKVVLIREDSIKESQEIIKDKNTTFPDKIKAYENIIANAGLNQPRGVLANKELSIAKEKMNSFENKFKDILKAHNSESVANRVKIIDQLQKEVSSKEEAQFLEKEKEKILSSNSESIKMLKNFNDLMKKKDFSNAFAVGKKIIENYSDTDAITGFALPFNIAAQTNLLVKINGKAIDLPYDGLLPIDQTFKIQADKVGCSSISLVLDKNIKAFEVELLFKKSELWQVDFKGNFDVQPKISLGGKGVVFTNGTDLEMVLLENGGKVWRRQINNPSKPFKKSDGTLVIHGDDEFWKLDSPISVFENYIAICSKNSELFVLSSEDGNNVVKFEMNYISKCAPMMARLPLLGNKAFVYAGTDDGNLICVAIEDQTERFVEKLGDSNNSILGIYPLNENFFVVILEQSVQCFTLSTSKLKWSKKFNSKVKNAYRVGSKIYVRQLDGLLELSENIDNSKNVSFPIRDIKSIQNDGKNLILLGENKCYYLDTANGRFLPVGDKKIITPILFSNGKFIEQNENNLVAIDNTTFKDHWETDKTKSKIKNMCIVESTLFYLEEGRLHALLIGE